MFQPQYDYSANAVELQPLFVRGLAFIYRNWRQNNYSDNIYSPVVITDSENKLYDTAADSVTLSYHVCPFPLLLTDSFCGKRLNYLVCILHYQMQNTHVYLRSGTY